MLGEARKDESGDFAERAGLRAGKQSPNNCILNVQTVVEDMTDKLSSKDR